MKKKSLIFLFSMINQASLITTCQTFYEKIDLQFHERNFFSVKLKITVWNSPIILRHDSYLLSRLLRQWWQAKQSSVACQCWPPCATWPAYHMNNIIRSKYAFVFYTQWVKNWKKNLVCTLKNLQKYTFLLACSIVLSVFWELSFLTSYDIDSI